MANGLYMPDGSFQEFTEREELTTEFATRVRAGGGMSGLVGWLPDPDPILRKRVTTPWSWRT